MTSLALIVPSASRGGGGDVWLEQLLAQIGRDLAPLVIFGEDGDLARAAAVSGCRVVTDRRVGLSALLARERPELCIAWSPRAQLHLARARRGGDPAGRIAWVQHVLPSDFWIHRLAAGTRADAVLCVSSAVARRQAALYPGQPVHLLHPGVDTPVPLSRTAARAALGLGDGPPIVAVIGRLEPWKGQDLAVEAIAYLAQGGRPVRLAFIGAASSTWPEFDRVVRTAVEASGVGPLVSFHGHRADVPAILPAFDIVLSSSREEGFGIAIVEAMAAGVPVVATRSGGPEDILSHDRTGLLVPSNDPTAIVAAVDALLNEPSRMAYLARQARQAYRERFTAVCSADAFRSLLARLRRETPADEINRGSTSA